MARNFILAIGALLWAAFAIAVIVLFVIGHWVAPTITLIVGVPLLAWRWNRRSAPQAA